MAEPKYFFPTECARRLSFACEVAPGFGMVLVEVGAPWTVSINRAKAKVSSERKRGDILKPERFVFKAPLNRYDVDIL